MNFLSELRQLLLSSSSVIKCCITDFEVVEKQIPVCIFFTVRNTLSQMLQNCKGQFFARGHAQALHGEWGGNFAKHEKGGWCWWSLTVRSKYATGRRTHGAAWQKQRKKLSLQAVGQNKAERFRRMQISGNHSFYNTTLHNTMKCISK